LVATSSTVGANGLRRFRFVAIFAVLGAALIAAPSARAALPGGYTSNAVDDPSPTSTADRFGENFANAGDVNGDGGDDLIVGVPDAPNSTFSNVTGRVVFVNGATGSVIRTVIAPAPPSDQISHIGDPVRFGARVATLGDIGSCVGTTCTVGPPDNVPEHLVSAPGTDISVDAADMGAVYVLDGASFRVLKKIQLASGDLPASTPGFGLALAGFSGEPACQGFGGIAACPDPPSSPVARGDVDGDGIPDLVVGAPDYAETAETNFAGCGAPEPDPCPGLGRVYVYSGKDIAGSASTVLNAPLLTIKWFDRTTASEQPRLGAGLTPIGDVGRCALDPGAQLPDARCQQDRVSNVQDGYPDFLVSAPGADVSGNADAGKAFVVDGGQGVVIGALASPEPQANAGFGSFPNAVPAPGDLAGSSLPDLYLPALGQDTSVGADQGLGYAFDGNVTALGLIARLDDPAPAQDGKFGVYAGLGDVVGADAKGEFALGHAGANGGPVQVFSLCPPTHLQTIPDQEPGAGFGAAIAPMGDLNGDGYLDLAVGAPGSQGVPPNQVANVGRIYFMVSNGTPGPSLQSCAPPPQPGGGGGSGQAGGSTSSPPSPAPSPRKRKRKSKSRTVTTLAKRKLRLSTKKTIKVGGLLTLKGRLVAKKRSCRAHQKIALQRLGTDSNYFTINVGVSKRDGRFATSTRPAPAQTFFYRARVAQTRKCTGAISKRVKVVAKDVAA
jgi:hypothetical protein